VQRFHGNATIDRGPWLLSVAIPRAEVLRRLAPLWRRNITLTAIALACVISLTLWISWHTAFTLRRLRDAAHRIAGGDFSPPEQKPVHNREMHQLQASFVTMAERLRTAREALEQQLDAVRTLQRQVVRQERLAAVGLLVSGVAHELNNPLQAIMGNVEVIERTPGLSDDVVESIAFVKAQSDRANDIIRSLARFSRGGAGTPALIGLQDVIAEVLQLRKRELDSVPITVQIETSSTRMVFATFAELEQVVLNFVVNAQQAIESSGRNQGRIRIRLADAGVRVRLEVADDGPGVPREDEPKLFQPFFTTKPVGYGTGLGLSVSYGIIDAYGGITGYALNEWGGATFYFELPAVVTAREGQSTNDGAALLHRRASSGV
jgi:signal transduction histidine kinase